MKTGRAGYRASSSALAVSQLRPSNGRIRVETIPAGSRQRALTLQPSGWERGM
jgi:hypothetical protein